MKSYLVSIPAILRWTQPRSLWRVHGSGNTVYLTFDDGPTPGITDELLEMLRAKEVPATFFCRGEQVEKFPGTYRRITEHGHALGNHTWSHLNGWKTSTDMYLQDVQRCAGVVDSTLFRPPYGRLKRAQRKQLENHFQVVMWDVMPGDFDPSIPASVCTRNAVTRAVPGSIIVFHDNDRAGPKMLSILPDVIDQLRARNFKFGKLVPPIIG